MELDIPSVMRRKRRCELQKEKLGRHPPISFFTPDPVTCRLRPKSSNYRIMLVHIISFHLVTSDNVAAGYTTDTNR